MRVVWSIIMLLAVMLNPVKAAPLSADQQTAYDAAINANQSVRQYAGSGQAINDNLTEPLVTDRQLSKFNGERYSAKIGCDIEKVALEMTVIPGAGGDAEQLIVAQDINNDGTMDNTLASPFRISGICSNGVISCDEGTWNNCNHYRWGATATGILQFDTVSVKQLGGCYCVNNSCGTNLIQRNLQNVLGDLSGGALATMSKVTNNFAASRLQITGLTGKYFVNELGGCGENPTDQTTYINNPGQISADAFSAASTDTTYDLLTNSDAANDKASSVNSCAIKRNITVTHDLMMVPSCIEGTWFKVARTSRNFDTYGDDAWLEAQAFCDPDAPLRIRFRAWDGAGKTHCNAAMGADNEGFVALPAPVNDTVSNGYVMTHPNLRGTGCYDVPVFYNGSCTASDGLCTFNFTAYDGTKLPVWDSWIDWDYPAEFSTQSCAERITTPTYDPPDCIDVPGGSVIHEGSKNLTLMFERPHFTPTPDLNTCRLDAEWLDNGCTALETDADCNVLEETVDGTTTILDFQPTGNIVSPSATSVSDGICNLNFTRDYWNKNRTYQCVKNTGWDLTQIEERVSHINQNTVESTGTYKDKILENGVWVEPNTSGIEIAVPFPAQPTCTKACKTRKLTESSSVATFGVESDLRVNSDTYDYFFYECDAVNACPMGVGEELVSACGCLSEFGEAASMINMMRHASRDSICTSGVPQEAINPDTVLPAP